MRKAHIAVLLAALAMPVLTACESGVVDDRPRGRAQGPFWQGDVCFDYAVTGKIVRVPSDRCPPKT